MHQRNGIWWIDTKRNGRRIRQSLKTREKREAARRAREILDAVDRDTLGLRPTARPTRLIEDLVNEYEVELRRRGRTDEHVKQVVSGIGRLSILAEVDTLDAWDARATERALSMLANRSARQRNKLRGFCSAFFRWLIKTGRHDRNPISGVDPIPAAPRWDTRRALTPEELAALLSWSPEPRSLIYRVAATTGLRRSEMERLRHDDIDFGRREIHLRPEATKNRKAATLPLLEETVQAWQAWLEDPHWLLGLDKVECSSALPPVPNVRTMRDDLEVAGIDPSGRRIDIHALRVTFVTNLARAGVPIEMASDLARHSDLKLTAKIYTRFQPTDRHAAVDRLADLLRRSVAHDPPTIHPPGDPEDN